MKYKYNDQWVDVNIKALDSMPVGTKILFDGDVLDIPVGWEEVNDYSTTEIDTGRLWVDGKKIYRKTFTGNYNSGTELLSGVDTLVNHYGTAYISGATRCVPYMEIYNGNMFDAQFRVLNNKIVSEFMNNGSTVSSDISVTFEYTKTTNQE